MRRNSLYGPHMNVFNMSAAKSFGLPWEDVKIEFRADASNVFNHPSFSNPGGVNLGGSSGPGMPYTSTDTITSVNIGGRNHTAAYAPWRASSGRQIEMSRDGDSSPSLPFCVILMIYATMCLDGSE